ncbi:MAG TPA: 3-deoxy-7-phosphoheptulonate synthase class II [Phycisphaerales bacterium]|nr:3-deoxy-7-phosphoheptulonate synthase class II [Phycisphaerales bacterium]
MRSDAGAAERAAPMATGGAGAASGERTKGAAPVAAQDDEWTPASWQRRRATQQPSYAEPAALEAVLATLSRLPPLVTSWEIEALRLQLAEAAEGRRFLLQGGDCAESFEECESSAIAAKLKVLLQMSLVLVHGARVRVTRVGRFAGQYAKPRSAEIESRGDVTLPSYRGDIVNGPGFSQAERNPDPQRLLRAYERSALTLNFIRALIDGGFADLHHPEYWDLDWVKHSELAAEYQRMVESIGESLRFMETLAGAQVGHLNRVDFFTSHEALLLHYEAAQTRQVPHRSGWYNLATHFPWIGVRTNDPEGAHVEYLRGIANPVAVKVSSATAPDAVLRLADLLDPRHEPGRLTFIHRFGAHAIGRGLPPLVEAIAKTGRRVLWVCDPMHGNTETTAGGIKTRKFGHILAEIEQAFEIHRAAGTRLGGVHVELTGENVTECTGGARNLADDDLRRAYRSHVDPRLNYEQALELAMLVARRMSGR